MLVYLLLGAATLNAFGTWSYRSCVVNQNVLCVLITSIILTCLTVFLVARFSEYLRFFNN